jgi:hypothetical protein
MQLKMSVFCVQFEISQFWLKRGVQLEQPVINNTQPYQPSKLIGH